MEGYNQDNIPHDRKEPRIRMTDPLKLIYLVSKKPKFQTQKKFFEGKKK